MNKRYKLLSLLLSAGVVISAFPSLGTGATSDSISFYNAKKTILDMKEYDEAYDTNHDGVVNVFDVIRENKEVFQEESYTDLKSKIYSLETQIEILTQKLTEKEDKSQAESDFSEINFMLSGKVDIQEGKQLSSNDYTDKDKNKLASLENYNDSDIKSEISSINFELSSINDSISNKVDQQEGKQLSSNDYTDSDKEKLENLKNYDDTKINEKFDSLVQIAYEEKKEIESSIENKVDKEKDKQLSSNDFTNEDKEKLSSLENYDDSKIKIEINELENQLSKLKNEISKSNLNSVDSSNILYGKTIVFCGDSITYGEDMDDEGWTETPSVDMYQWIQSSMRWEKQTDNVRMTYGYQIASRNNMVYYNGGVSGSTAQGMSENWGFSCDNGRYTLLPDEIDYLTLFFGWNDTAYGTLGTINDTTNQSYYGAYNVVMPYLISKYPYTKICLIVPFGCDTEHRNAIRELANKWGVACFDMYQGGTPLYYGKEDSVGVSEAVVVANRAKFQANGAHPNYKGHKQIADMLESFLRGL